MLVAIATYDTTLGVFMRYAQSIGALVDESELFDGHIGTVLDAARDEARRAQVDKALALAKAAAAQDSSDTALSDGSSEALPLSNPPESAANQENSSTGKSFGQLFHISVRVPPAFIAALTAILVVIGAVTAGIRFLQMQRRQEEDALAERRRQQGR